MEEIIYVDGASLFLSVPMNEKYHKQNDTSRPEISYTGKDIVVPATYLTPDAKIYVVINEGNHSEQIYDWTITKVERKEKDNLSSYYATYHSKKAETYDYKKAKDLLVYVRSFGSTEERTYSFKFKVKNSKEWVFFDKAEFEEIK